MLKAQIATTMGSPCLVPSCEGISLPPLIKSRNGEE